MCVGCRQRWRSRICWLTFPTLGLRPKAHTLAPSIEVAAETRGGWRVRGHAFTRSHLSHWDEGHVTPGSQPALPKPAAAPHAPAGSATPPLLLIVARTNRCPANQTQLRWDVDTRTSKGCLSHFLCQGAGCSFSNGGVFLGEGATTATRQQKVSS